ncbi:MAG: nucleotidyltransferase domain-containing protein [Burkholderiales bacterium]
MGRKPEDAEPSLFGRTRQTLLALLFTHSDQVYYLEQIFRLARLGRGTVQRELDFLVRAGLVKRSVSGRQVYFQANADSPVFAELKSLVLKTTGLADVLRSALAGLADRIRIAFVYGSMARLDERRSSDVDLLVVGAVAFEEVSDALAGAQEALAREINATVYPVEEFRAKASSAHFLRSVLATKKVFVVGDERELGRLAKK